MELDEWISSVMTIGGEQAPPELAQARLQICRGCEYREFSRLTPISEKKERCGKCKCPLDRKPFVLSNRKKLSILNKLERTECPHPEGNKWHELDITFLGEEKVKKLSKL